MEKMGVFGCAMEARWLLGAGDAVKRGGRTYGKACKSAESEPAQHKRRPPVNATEKDARGDAHGLHFSDR